jgi:hypothetical protein
MMAARLAVVQYMQTNEECNITVRLDQQMYEPLVQILDNQKFCPDHFIKTIDMLDILDDMKILHTLISHLTVKVYQTVVHQAMTSSHHIHATTHVQKRGPMRVLKWRTENRPYNTG